MNKQLFIGANIPQNTKNEAINLVKGEIGIFGINASTYQTEKVSGTNYDKIWISLGVSATKQRNSRIIQLPVEAHQFEYKKIAYSPFIPKTFSVTIDCDGTNGMYNVLALKISDRGGDDLSGTEWGARTYEAVGKFATRRDVYNEWARIIQSEPISNTRVVVQATDGGLLVTPQFWDQEINIGVEYYDSPARPICATCDDCDATATVQNEADAGSGHYWHLKQLALDSAPYSGTAYYADRLLKSPAADLDAEVLALGNADILYLKWKNKDQSHGDHGQVFDMYQEVFLAFPTGTDTAALENVLNTVLGATIKTSLAS